MTQVASCFGLIWSSRPSKEVRRAVLFVMPEPRPIRFISEAQDPETQLKFSPAAGRDSCAAFHCFLQARLILTHRTHINIRKVDASRFSQSAHPTSKRRTKTFLFKPPSALIGTTRNQGFSCRKISKEGHAEKSRVVLYV